MALGKDARWTRSPGQDMMRLSICSLCCARRTVCWRTPVQADAKGFCDLILLRNGQGLAIELKREKKLLEPEQIAWLHAFDLVQGFEAYTWRPSDWLSGRIEKALM